MCCEIGIVENKYRNNTNTNKKRKLNHFHSALNSNSIILDMANHLKNKIEPRVSAATKKSFIGFLLSLSAIDINIPDCYGRTPLHYACEANDIGTCKQLISYGANISVEDKEGFQPYNLTTSYEIKEYLETHQNVTQCKI